ncbi:MAG: restriction endonuclease [Chitinivibrionales bacterium]|nr:restriction endonuclease [Chitinivibrionales bacterium]
MDREELKKLFAEINVWKRGSQRAPHKPLLLLYALGRCNRGSSRTVVFSEVDPILQKLLRQFGPSRRSYHPEYPFWRLQNDGIWELENAESVELRKGQTDAKKSELLSHDVSGGFPRPIYELLSRDKAFIAEIARDILDQNFPTSMHDDLLQAVGLDLDRQVISRAKRDPDFRNRVMTAYEYRCAVCGFDVRLGSSQLGVEAAHIKWHQAGGPDVVPNGLALCSLHHKLFDRGVFTVSKELQIQVSEHAHGTSGFEEWLLAFHGKQLRAPQRPDYYPKADFLRWHFREVFRTPARYVRSSLS